jgi:hypothetical protein
VIFLNSTGDSALSIVALSIVALCNQTMSVLRFRNSSLYESHSINAGRMPVLKGVWSEQKTYRPNKKTKERWCPSTPSQSTQPLHRPTPHKPTQGGYLVTWRQIGASSTDWHVLDPNTSGPCVQIDRKTARSNTRLARLTAHHSTYLASWHPPATT